MTTDDAPRLHWTILADGPSARLLWHRQSRRYRWQVWDDHGALLVQRDIDVYEAAALHALLPTKMREMP